MTQPFATTRSLATCALALLAVLSAAFAGAQSAVTVSDAWIREAPPGVAVMAGYFTLEHHSGEPRALIGVRGGEHFARVEMHHTRVRDGVVRMQAVDGIHLPDGERLEFSPGGLHLMLMEPRRALVAGDAVTLTLEFDDGEVLPVVFEVRDLRTHGGTDHGHDEHEPHEHGGDDDHEHHR